MAKDIFGDEVNAQDSKDFADLLNSSKSQLGERLQVGDKVTGEILTISKDEAFVATGTINDGVIMVPELKDESGELKYNVGDRIEVYVTYARGTDVRLSFKHTAKNLADDLEDAFDKMLPVEGRITETCKGGVRLQILGKNAFCPISQIDIRHVEDPATYVGRKVQVLITQFENGGRNIVVSHRKYLEERKAEAEGAFLQERQEGDVVEGIVTRLEKYGAFADLGDGIEGLVHISEASWARLENVSEVVSIGDKISAKILKIEDLGHGLKVSLSMKQTTAEPWENLPESIYIGAMVTGRVTRCMKFGAFVEVVPGVEGLVPLSEMSYAKRVTRSDEIVKEGESVMVAIKEINRIDKKMLLSVKDAGGDPWTLVNQKFPVGIVVEGTVEKKEQYGYFINLEPGITGLFPKAEYRDNPELAEIEKLKAGDKVKIQVKAVDFESRRMTLVWPGEEADNSWQQFSQEKSDNFGSLGSAFKIAMDKGQKKKR
jgi:small subunit ribosomal protein S1